MILSKTRYNPKQLSVNHTKPLVVGVSDLNIITSSLLR